MAGKIPQAFIDHVLIRVDIVDVIDRRVPLTRKGKEYQACYPFFLVPTRGRGNENITALDTASSAVCAESATLDTALSAVCAESTTLDTASSAVCAESTTLDTASSAVCAESTTLDTALSAVCAESTTLDTASSAVCVLCGYGLDWGIRNGGIRMIYAG